MKGKGSPEFFAFAKKGILWLLILIFYFLGLLSYGRIQNSESVPVYFSSSYPDGNRVREILEREKEGKNPRGLCFYWDGGSTELLDPLQGRKAEALLGGVCGDAMWYDVRSNGFSEADSKGCLIDEETAAALFGGAEPVGRTVELQGNTYQVRRVIPWKERLVLIPGPSGKTVYTKVFLQIREGESKTNAISAFLMAYGLGGRSAEEGSLYLGAFLFLLLFPGAILLKLFLMALRERRNSREWKQRWSWNLILLLLAGTLLYLLWEKVELPRDWIPGKWSDFQFFPDKWKEGKENLRLFLMMPKTMEQAENLLWMGKSMWYSLLSFFLFCYSCVDSRQYGAYDGNRWRCQNDIYNKKNKNER